MQICIILIRIGIRIQRFTLMRIQLYTLMRIRILLLIGAGRRQDQGMSQLGVRIHWFRIRDRQLRFRIHISARNKDIFKTRLKRYQQWNLCFEEDSSPKRSKPLEMPVYVLKTGRRLNWRHEIDRANYAKERWITYWASAQIQSPSDGLKSLDFLMSMLWKMKISIRI